MEPKKIVRIANTDLMGDKSIHNALRKIKGVSFSFSNIICNHLNLEKNKKVGLLTEQEVKKIEDLFQNPKDIPKWTLNRQKDYDSGEYLQLTGVKIGLQKSFDIKKLQKIKSNRGLRHAWGLPVRGQRTRGNFRKGKSVGVQKKKIQSQKKGSKGKKGK
ncbi:30S ribosomal protein S13 [archaeon]|nr:30S ribosomal protein S13 [archaeon]